MKNILLIVLLLALLACTISTHADSGAIWTTNGDCGNASQDLNHYGIGDVIYVNGAGFASGLNTWSVGGQPGGASCDPGMVVANGTIEIGETGSFCFAAYTVNEGDCGEYKVNAADKKDNYRVDEPPITAAEFKSMSALLALLLVSPAFAYLVTKRKT